jgi:hypothetical protein
MKDTQDVNVVVCDNVGNSVMAIKENTDISFQFFAVFKNRKNRGILPVFSVNKEFTGIAQRRPV